MFGCGLVLHMMHCQFYLHYDFTETTIFILDCFFFIFLEYLYIRIQFHSFAAF